MAHQIQPLELERTFTTQEEDQEEDDEQREGREQEDQGEEDEEQEDDADCDEIKKYFSAIIGCNYAVYMVLWTCCVWSSPGAWSSLGIVCLICQQNLINGTLSLQMSAYNQLQLMPTTVHHLKLKAGATTAYKNVTRAEAQTLALS